MNKILSCLITLIVIISRPLYSGMTIPPDIKKTVCFIYVKKGIEYKPNGTGFFLVTKNPDINVYHGYLVTAKHVLKPDPKKEVYYKNILIRLNKKKGGVKKILVNLVLKGRDRTLFIHEDKSIDIAVVTALPKFELFDYKVITKDYLTSNEDLEKLNISEGSDIFFSGMFTPHLGKEHNYPIVRFGRIALFSDENIIFDGEERDLILIDTFSFGGNSGSPVFAYLGSDRNPGSLIVGSPILKLIGIMSGTYLKGIPIVEVPTSVKELSLDNMGIAAVVPCKYLLDIIYSKELKKIRGY